MMRSPVLWLCDEAVHTIPRDMFQASMTELSYPMDKLCKILSITRDKPSKEQKEKAQMFLKEAIVPLSKKLTVSAEAAVMQMMEQRLAIVKLEFPDGSPVQTVAQLKRLWQEHRPRPEHFAMIFQAIKGLQLGGGVFDKLGPVMERERYERGWLQLRGLSYRDGGVREGVPMKATKMGHRGETSGGCIAGAYSRAHNTVKRAIDPSLSSPARNAKKCQNQGFQLSSNNSQSIRELQEQKFGRRVVSSWKKFWDMGNNVTYDGIPLNLVEGMMKERLWQSMDLRRTPDDFQGWGTFEPPKDDDFSEATSSESGDAGPGKHPNVTAALLAAMEEKLLQANQDLAKQKRERERESKKHQQEMEKARSIYSQTSEELPQGMASKEKQAYNKYKPKAKKVRRLLQQCACHCFKCCSTVASLI